MSLACNKNRDLRHIHKLKTAVPCKCDFFTLDGFLRQWNHNNTEQDTRKVQHGSRMYLKIATQSLCLPGRLSQTRPNLSLSSIIVSILYHGLHEPI